MQRMLDNAVFIPDLPEKGNKKPEGRNLQA